jgi:hypothetical protein
LFTKPLRILVPAGIEGRNGFLDNIMSLGRLHILVSIRGYQEVISWKVLGAFLRFCSENSLIPEKNSLFPEKISLLVQVGIAQKSPRQSDFLLPNQRCEHRKCRFPC